MHLRNEPEDSVESLWFKEEDGYTRLMDEEGSWMEGPSVPLDEAL